MSLSGKRVIPFSEPPYLSGLTSVYLKPTHLIFQQKLRQYLEKHFLPYAELWEDEGQVPDHAFQKFVRDGLFLPSMETPLPVAAIKREGIHSVVGTPLEEIDNFHLMVFYDEIFRCGLTGPINSQMGGYSIVSPYLVQYGSDSIHNRFLGDLISGRKRWCIALTEPRGGSDIASTSTTAVKSADGKHYIVNGEKKWITGGIFSDFALVVVRTGGPKSGASGLSIIVMDLKHNPGVSAERFYCSGQYSAGSTHFTFKDVKVPIENLIGVEGLGLKYIINGLNHERLAIAAGVTRQARLALSTAYKHCLNRETFGKTLIDHGTVRHKIATAGIALEALQSWLEACFYQKQTLPKAEKDEKLGAIAAMAKARAGQVFAECGNLAVLLFGGLGYTKTGPGALVEKLYREIPGTRIPGGAEDVLLDSAIKQMTKIYRADQRKGASQL